MYNITKLTEYDQRLDELAVMYDKFAFPRNEDMFLFLDNYPKEKKSAPSDPKAVKQPVKKIPSKV